MLVLFILTVMSTVALVFSLLYVAAGKGTIQKHILLVFHLLGIVLLIAYSLQIVSLKDEVRILKENEKPSAYKHIGEDIYRKI